MNIRPLGNRHTRTEGRTNMMRERVQYRLSEIPHFRVTPALRVSCLALGGPFAYRNPSYIRFAYAVYFAIVLWFVQ